MEKQSIIASKQLLECIKKSFLSLIPYYLYKKIFTMQNRATVLFAPLMSVLLLILQANGILSVSSACYNTKIPLHRYYNSGTSDHFYTTSWSELEGGSKGYVYEGVAAQVYQNPESGTSPLHRYYNSRTGDHFYTLNWQELQGGSGGYVYEGIQAYIYPNALTGTLPLYHYYSGKTGDNFYTTNWSELGGGKDGYISKGIAGYVC